MPKRRTEIYQLIDLAKIHHENVSWSNVIINSPISYNLLERRAMYFLSAEVKHKFVEKGLGVPDNWKELFQLSEEDFSKEIVAKSSYDLYNASFMSYLIQVVLFLKLAYVHHIIHDDEMNILINLLSNPRMREYAAIAYKLFDEALMDGDSIINKHKKLYADLLTRVLLKKNISAEEVTNILEKHKGE